MAWKRFKDLLNLKASQMRHLAFIDIGHHSMIDESKEILIDFFVSYGGEDRPLEVAIRDDDDWPF